MVLDVDLFNWVVQHDVAMGWIGILYSTAQQCNEQPLTFTSRLHEITTYMDDSKCFGQSALLLEFLSNRNENGYRVEERAYRVSRRWRQQCRHVISR
jgi:hypothetical protein